MIKFFVSVVSIIFAFTVNAETKHHHKSKHHHKVYQATKPYPKIQLQVKKDSMDGFNLTIVTSNFRFAAKRINKTNGPNEGHAHIYINGEKIRQYSPYFHLSGKLLRKGENKIRVSLHANDHSYFVVDKETIQQTVIIKK
jgi:hypothetical protein